MLIKVSNICNLDVYVLNIFLLILFHKEPRASRTHYPVGAVLATATVYFKGTEVMEYTLPSDAFGLGGTAGSSQEDQSQEKNKPQETGGKDIIQQSRVISFRVQ